MGERLPRAETVEDAIAIMDRIIERAWDQGDPRGLFASLYRGVTRRVADDIARGAYDDGDRMSRFDAVFANRWFDALDAFDASLAPTRAWRIALEAGRDRRTTIVQHLLLGMNAHINLDLGIAAAEATRDGGMSALFGDFERINDLLQSMLDECQALIAKHSPMMRLLDTAALRADEILVNFSIRRARQSAWENAQDLDGIDPARYGRVIDRIDRKAAMIGRLVADPGRAIGALVSVVRLWEGKDVRAIIETLQGLGASH